MWWYRNVILMALRNKIHCIQHITKAFPSGLLTLDWPSYSCVTTWRNKFLWNAGCISESICLKKNVHLVGNDFWILLRGGNALRNNGVFYIYICFLWWPLFQNSSFALNTRVKSLHIHDFSGSTHTALVKHKTIHLSYLWNKIHCLGCNLKRTNHLQLWRVNMLQKM